MPAQQNNHDMGSLGMSPQEQQIRQQYIALFQNAQTCERYISMFNTDTIPVPPDPTTRKIAMDVAQEVIKNYSSEGRAPGDDWSVQGRSNRLTDKQICVKAARKFIRKCNTYIAKNATGNRKEAGQMLKQNPGVGAYTVDQLTPQSQNLADIRQAAVNAGNKAAYLDKSNNQEELNILENQIAQLLSNKIYNVYFFYTYYSAMAGEDPSDASQIGSKRGFQSDEEERKRIQTLRQLSKNYERYEAEFRGAGNMDNNAVTKGDQHRLNTYGGMNNGVKQ